MAWSFGDGFDLYAAIADMLGSYWDAGSATNMALVAGRFTGSQALGWGGGSASLTKTSGVNDAVHHFTVAFRQTSTMGGASSGFYLRLMDGATAQCTIQFRQDGAIVLISGSAGATLATYAGAFTVTGTWYQFEFEFVIHNSTGSFKVRKNGNPSDDHSTTGIDTQNSANAYANAVVLGTTGLVAHQIDDLFWRSDAASVAWMGDIRCFTRMPSSDQSVTFSRTPTGAGTVQTVGQTGNSVTGAIATYTAVTASFVGSITNVTVAVATVGSAVNMKCAIFADSGIGGNGSPGALLASATAPFTPVAVGNATFTFSPGVQVFKGVQYWIGAIFDDSTGAAVSGVSGSTAGTNSSTTYAAFPVTSPVTTGSQKAANMTWTYGAAANWMDVAELQQDATTSYVYSITPGDADFYNIAPISSTPATVIACTTRSYALKSDVGTRTGAVQIKSGSTTVASPTVTLTTSGWTWCYRTDTTDPNTGAAWSPVAVNNVQIGPKTVA